MGKPTRATYLLTVLTGPNAGAQERLTKRKMRLGTSEAADLVLDEFEGEEVELAVTRDKLRVMTRREGVSVEAAGTCRPGAAQYVSLPATVNLTPQIQVNVCAAHAPPARRPMRRTAATLLVLGLLGGGAYVAQDHGLIDVVSVAQARAKAEPAKAEVAEVIQPEAVTPTATSTPAPQTAPRITFADAAKALDAGLAEAGLSGLDMIADAGVLRVNGLLSSAQMPVWGKLRGDYEARFGHIAPLLISIEEQGDAPPLAVASVWLGDNPELTTRDGATFALGDVTETGWTVAAIEAHAVRLEQGRTAVLIEF